METDRPVALVTGAGSGIGRAFCKRLAQEQYRLALVGRTAARLNETLRHMGGSNQTHLTITADIAKPQETQRVIDEIMTRFGRLDVLINNAGAVETVPLEQTTRNVLDRMFAVNVFGPAHLIAHSWPVFVKQGGGCIVNISSMSAVDPFPGLSAYAAAKAALESLTRSIHNEGGQHNIRCFAIAPGAVETSMLRSIASEDVLPTNRTLDPDEVAKVAVQCILGRRDEDIGRTIRIPSP